MSFRHSMGYVYAFDMFVKNKIKKIFPSYTHPTYLIFHFEVKKCFMHVEWAVSAFLYKP